MSRETTIDHLRKLLLHRRALLSEGATDAQLQNWIVQSELVRITAGWYVRAAEWQRLGSTEQHLLRILATERSAVRPPLFSHFSAAIVEGLPLLKFDPRRVHTLLPAGSRPSSGRGVVRHHADAAPEERVVIAGLQCTDPIRTAIDLSRSAGFEVGLVCADAAMRLLREQVGGGEAARGLMLRRLESLPHGNGSRRARRVLEFASPLADSPLESLARLQLARLGFEVREQVRVPSPDGREYRVDFELVGYGTFLEVDGRVKYTDERMRGGRELDEILLEEKHREDWVRGTTGNRLIRSGWSDAQTPANMAKKLIAFGIQPPAWPAPRNRIDLY